MASACAQRWWRKAYMAWAAFANKQRRVELSSGYGCSRTGLKSNAELPDSPR